MSIIIVRELVIEDIVEAVQFFSDNKYEKEYVDEYVRHKVKDIDFNDESFAHFGVNHLAREIVDELSIDD